MFKTGDIVRDVFSGEYMEVLEFGWKDWYKVKSHCGSIRNVIECTLVLVSDKKKHAYLLSKSGNHV